MNYSEIKETRTCYNYRKVSYILLNCRQKKSVKEKTEKENPKENLKRKLKFISKRELVIMARKTDK